MRYAKRTRCHVTVARAARGAIPRFLQCRCVCPLSPCGGASTPSPATASDEAPASLAARALGVRIRHRPHPFAAPSHS
eukprot:1144933-Pleurochrysis_carterae.AAC.1